MRVIVVDHDSTMLEAVARALSGHATLDAVTNKADCIDLLRANDFDLIVACERLADGSGLELLGQVAKRWPSTLRVFAADRERLKLLQGRLGPFDLFQALAYPIEPRKLLAVLSLADTELGTGNPAPKIQHGVSENEPGKPAATTARTALPAARAHAPTTARVSARPGQERRNNLPPRARPASRQANTRPVPPAPPRSSSDARRSAPPPAGHPSSRAEATTEPLPQAGEIAAAARASIDPLRAQAPANRTAFAIGAGIAVAVGVIGLAIKLSGARHDTRTGTLPAAVQPQFPKEVTDLVAAVEQDIKLDDFGQARSDIRKLRESAPGHPRLPFLQSLLDRDGGKARTRPPAPMPPGLRVASLPRPKADVANRQARSSIAAPVALPASERLASEPSPATSPAPSEAAGGRTAVASFSGRTLEDSTAPMAAPPANAAPAASTGSPVNVSVPPSVIQAAQLRRRVAPEYPAAAARKGIEGSVEIRFTISGQGTVENVAVVDSDPPEVFDRAAIDAVRRWRYDPRFVDGQPVESHAQVRLQFRLDSHSKSP